MCTLVMGGKMPGEAGKRRKSTYSGEIAAGKSPVHKLFTECAVFPLAIFSSMGYYVLALKEKEC